MFIPVASGILLVRTGYSKRKPNNFDTFRFATLAGVALTNAFPDSRNNETLRRLGQEGWRWLLVDERRRAKT